MEEHRIRADDVAGVVRKVVTAVINNGLECPDGSEESGLTVV